MQARDILAGLNKQQITAATLPYNHTLVLAGAGTGKTRTIVARAGHLVSKGIDPKRIQILTFTKKSAQEIIERIRQLVGSPLDGLRASTFHSWCISLIRSAPQAFGSKNFSVIDRDDCLEIMKISRSKSEGRVLNAKGFLDLYSYCRNTLKNLTLGLSEKYPELSEKRREIANVLVGYEKKKKENHYLDYDDILEVVARQTGKIEEVRRWVSANNQFILIDEFQDTNPLQWELLKPLTSSSILFCVGDDAQSIYGFRGADFKNIHNFKERVTNCTVVKLEENYRSTQEILNLSNWLLKQSPLEYGKNLIGVRGPGIKPTICNFTSEFAEGRWIAEDLVKRKENGASLNDHMILIRSAYSGRQVEAALIANDIPYIYIGGTKLLESSHIKDVMSVLRIVANPRDEIAWMRYLCLWPGIGEKTAAKILEMLSTVQSIELMLDFLEKNPKTQGQCHHTLLSAFINNQGVKSLFKETAEAMHDLLAEIYQHQEWDKRKSDFGLVEKLAETHTSISGFIEEYILNPIHHSALLSSKTGEKVTLITIHSAKGTEKNVCYVVNVSPGYFPSHYSIGKIDAIEEERRVLYVALTRARNELIITRQLHNTWARQDMRDQKLSNYFFEKLPQNLYENLIFRDDNSFRINSDLISNDLPEFGIDLS